MIDHIGIITVARIGINIDHDVDRSNKRLDLTGCPTVPVGPRIIQTMKGGLIGDCI